MKFLNLLKERSIFWSGEELSKAGLGRPAAPPRRLLERLIWVKLGRSHREGGTEPVRRLPERSKVRRWVMFVRCFHEIAPVRFLEERLMWEMEQVVLKNQEGLKPETEANALARRARSEVLGQVDDSDRERREMRSISLSIILIQR